MIHEALALSVLHRLSVSDLPDTGVGRFGIDVPGDWKHDG